jgi:hypothetical protein
MASLRPEFLHNQGLLISKMVAYLRQEAEEVQSSLNNIQNKESKEYKAKIEDYKNRMEVIHLLETVEAAGQCVGLSTLWAYGKRIADEPGAESKIAKDDINFFNETWKKLVLWDKSQVISQNLKSDFDRFISHVRYFQENYRVLLIREVKSVKQLNLSESLSDAKRGAPIKRFDQKIDCDNDILKNRLAQIIKPKTMIFLSCEGREKQGERQVSGHTMAIYQDSKNNIYFYNSNADEGEVLVKDFDDLAKRVWGASNPDNFEKGFVGFDPQTEVYRGNLWIEIYSFKEDPEYQYPSKANFKLSAQEFLNIANKPLFMALAAMGGIKKLIDSLEDLQIIEILREASLASKIKEMLVEQTVLYRENKSPILARYILLHHINLVSKPLTTTKEGGHYFKKYKLAKEKFEELSKQPVLEKEHYKNTNDILKIKDQLNLKEALHILYMDENIGNRALTEELLKHCLTYDGSTVLVFCVLEKNIRRGNIELAKTVASIVNDRFNRGLTIEGIRKLGNEDFARFMHEKFGNKYTDSFGTPQLEFMPKVIKEDRILLQKKEIMDKLTQQILLPQKKRSLDIIENYTKKAIEIKERLSLDDVLGILSLNAGNLELAMLFVTNCQKNHGKAIFGLFMVLRKNLQNGFLKVAESIVDLCVEKFKVMPSINAIESLGSEAFAVFMYEKYGDQYLDRFGNSELKFMPNIIAINRARDQRRNSIVQKINEQLDLDSTKIDLKKLNELALEILENHALLSPSEIIKALALKAGDMNFAVELLNRSSENYGQNEFYVNNLLLMRAINENIKRGRSEVANTILEFISTRHNLQYIFSGDAEKVNNPAYDFILDFVAKKKADADKIAAQKKAEQEKIRALEIEKENKKMAAQEQYNRAGSLNAVLNINFNFAVWSIEGDLDFSKKIVAFATAPSLILQSFDSKQHRNENQFKYELYEHFERDIQKIKAGKERIQKKISTFQNEAKKHLDSLEALLNVPELTDKQLEIKQMIQATHAKAQEMEHKKKQAIDELTAFEKEIIQLRESPFKEIDRQVKVLEDAKKEAQQLLNEVLDSFKRIGEETQQITIVAQTKLKNLTLDIQKNIQNGTDDSLPYAFKIRDTRDDALDTTAAQLKKLDNIEKIFVEKIMQLSNEDLIDIDLVSHFMTSLHKSKAEVKTLIGQSKEQIKASSDLVVEVFNRASDERDRRQSEERQRILIEESKKRQAAAMLAWESPFARNIGNDKPSSQKKLIFTEIQEPEKPFKSPELTPQNEDAISSNPQGKIKK